VVRFARRHPIFSGAVVFLALALVVNGIAFSVLEAPYRRAVNEAALASSPPAALSAPAGASN
jgi:hypothetical protein